MRFFVVPERDGDDFATVVNSLRDSRPGHEHRRSRRLCRRWGSLCLRLCLVSWQGFQGTQTRYCCCCSYDYDYYGEDDNNSSSRCHNDNDHSNSYNNNNNNFLLDAERAGSAHSGRIVSALAPDCTGNERGRTAHWPSQGSSEPCFATKFVLSFLGIVRPVRLRCSKRLTRLDCLSANFCTGSLMPYCLYRSAVLVCVN